RAGRRRGAAREPRAEPARHVARRAAPLAARMSDSAGRAAADAGRAPAPREHHLTVPRSARYVVLGEPGPHVRTLWVALHGYGQLAARFARRCAPLASEHALVAVPEALSRFYLD